MRRTFSGLICILAAAAAYACSNSSTHHTPDARHIPSCGDGICEPAEVNTCPQDCGMSMACNHDGICNDGETNTSCPDDCGGMPGSGSSGSGSGSGGGSGALNCTDQNTLIGCLACLAINVCTPPINATDCTTCITSLGSGAPQCNFNGVCDPGETSMFCPDCP
jgi:hypothetical protein